MPKDSGAPTAQVWGRRVYAAEQARGCRGRAPTEGRQEGARRGPGRPRRVGPPGQCRPSLRRPAGQSTRVCRRVCVCVRPDGGWGGGGGAWGGAGRRDGGCERTGRPQPSGKAAAAALVTKHGGRAGDRDEGSPRPSALSTGGPGSRSRKGGCPTEETGWGGSGARPVGRPGSETPSSGRRRAQVAQVPEDEGWTRPWGHRRTRHELREGTWKSACLRHTHRSKAGTRLCNAPGDGHPRPRGPSAASRQGQGPVTQQ